VTHDELRSLLAPYAAAVLPEAQAGAVREHLAGGCPTCLVEFYRMPVGVPAARRPGRSRRPWAIGALALLALVLTGGVVWLVSERRVTNAVREDAAAALAGCLAALDTQRAALLARVETREAERDAARSRAEEAERTSEAAHQELERARAELRRGRHPRVPGGDVERLLRGVDEVGVLRELVGSPGVGLVALEPVAPFEAARGHLLFHPARATALFVGFRLPPAQDGDAYRLRIVLGGEGMGDRPIEVAFKPAGTGDVTLPVTIGLGRGAVRAVEVLRGAGERVLVRPAADR
jgi:hypothetical protein